jgi:hypothetical protein
VTPDVMDDINEAAGRRWSPALPARHRLQSRPADTLR